MELELLWRPFHVVKKELAIKCKQPGDARRRVEAAGFFDDLSNGRRVNNVSELNVVEETLKDVFEHSRLPVLTLWGGDPTLCWQALA